LDKNEKQKAMDRTKLKKKAKKRKKMRKIRTQQKKNNNTGDERVDCDEGSL